MARPATIPAALLIEDLDYYPRANIDTTHVSDLVRALQAGVKTPPVIADRASKRLVDGWHRRRALLKHFGPQTDIEVFWRDYDNEAEMYADAVQLNASHGRKFSSWDHTRIAIRCKELEMEPQQVAVLIHRTEDYVRDVITVRVARNEEGETIALKRPMLRYANTVVSENVERMNQRSSGWSVGYHAQQLREHLEAGTAEMTPALVTVLARLRDLLVDLELDTTD